LTETQDLIWAIKDLTKAIEEHTKIKKRGIELAQEIEDRRKVWVEP